jgi:hypothetical protein
MGQFSIGDPGQFCTGGYNWTPDGEAERLARHPI